MVNNIYDDNNDSNDSSDDDKNNLHRQYHLNSVATCCIEICLIIQFHIVCILDDFCLGGNSIRQSKNALLITE